MSFVSYAQNFEDVMLWRALRHVERGFYVDVGAQHPVIDSVSKAFYEHGWRGIHIEPVPEFAELLRKDRPDETVLQLALSDVEGTLDINVFPGTGLSTFVDTYAGSHLELHGVGAVKVTVPVLTLAQVLRDNAGRETHWLKIDVEGFEERVLRGWDSKAFRPWIIVIEATVPGSAEPVHANWDPILVAADYKFVYFDGLNRFYVAQEHSELEAAFSSPPNVFDGARLSGQASSQLCQGLIASHRASMQERDANAARLTEELDATHQRAKLLEAELQASLESEVRQQANAQRLQDELTAAGANIDGLELRAQALQAEWDASRRDVDVLEQQVDALEQRADALQQQVDALEQRADALQQQVDALKQQAVGLNAEIAWLQGELSASEAKGEEHRNATHHWWVVADSLNRELQGVYSSRSWRITAPLRQAMQAASWFWRAASRPAQAFVALARRAARMMLPSAGQRSTEGEGTAESAGSDGAAGTTGPLGPSSASLIPSDAEAGLQATMTPRARRILARLRHSIDSRDR